MEGSNALRENAICALKPTSDGPMIWIQMHGIIDAFVTFRLFNTEPLKSRSLSVTRRLLALAEIYDGGSRPDAARIGGVGVQIVRDLVVRFNAKGPDGLLTGKAPVSSVFTNPRAG